MIRVLRISRNFTQAGKTQMQKTAKNEQNLKAERTKFVVRERKISRVEAGLEG
jgi:hypothetical protein